MAGVVRLSQQLPQIVAVAILGAIALGLSTERLSSSQRGQVESSEKHLGAYMALLYLQTQGEWGGAVLQHPVWDAPKAAHAVRLLDRVVQWMPESDYPFFLASEVWSVWGNRASQQVVLEWVVNQSQHKPAKRWRWVVQAIWVARYRWHDLPTALRYATVLQNQWGVPPWAQSLGGWICEVQHDYVAAAGWIGRLLQAGVIHDPAELAFLEQRLEELKNSKK